MNFFKRLFSWKKKPSKIEDEKEDEIVDSDDNKIDKKKSKKLKKIAEPDPEPRVRFREFADHGLKLQLLFWIQNPEIRGRTVDAVNSEIFKQISEDNISIPYPTMSVHLSSENN